MIESNGLLALDLTVLHIDPGYVSYSGIQETDQNGCTDQSKRTDLIYTVNNDMRAAGFHISPPGLSYHSR